MYIGSVEWEAGQEVRKLVGDIHGELSIEQLLAMRSEDEQRALDQALAALLPATFADPRERWSAISARVEGRRFRFFL